MVNASELLESGTNFVKSNVGSIATVGAVAGASVLGVGVGALTVSKIKSSRARKRRKSKATSRRNRNRTHKRTSRRKGRRSPRTAGKGKDTSRKRIRYTKNGQPYVIMASGKARFIKKKGAKQSHRRKGGRY